MPGAKPARLFLETLASPLAAASGYRMKADDKVCSQLCAFSRLLYTMLIEPSPGLLIETNVLSEFVCMLFAFIQAYSVLLLVHVCMKICRTRFTWADVAV